MVNAFSRLRHSLAILFVFVACYESSTVSAQSIYSPLGLQAGDEYRLLFVTNGMRDALSTNITDYNAFVELEARLPGSLVNEIAVEWFAIASTTDTNAIENTATDPSPDGATGVPIYLVDGQTRFAEHYDNLWDGDSHGQVYLAGGTLTQFGVLPPGGPSNDVWTGTNYFGMDGGFGGPLGSSSNPTVGVSAAFNGRWINNNFTSYSRNRDLSFYALSSVLVAVPEPSSMALLSVLTLTAISWRR